MVVENILQEVKAAATAIQEASEEVLEEAMEVILVITAHFSFQEFPIY